MLRQAGLAFVRDDQVDAPLKQCPLDLLTVLNNEQNLQWLIVSSAAEQRTRARDRAARNRHDGARMAHVSVAVRTVRFSVTVLAGLIVP